MRKAAPPPRHTQERFTGKTAWKKANSRATELRVQGVRAYVVDMFDHVVVNIEWDRTPSGKRRP